MEFTIICPCCGQPIEISIADAVPVVKRGGICNKYEPSSVCMSPELIEFGEGGETNIERAHHT